MKLTQNEMTHIFDRIKFAFARAAKLKPLLIVKVRVGLNDHSAQSFKFQRGQAQNVAAPRAFNRGFGLHHKEVSSESPKFNSYFGKIIQQGAAV